MEHPVLQLANANQIRSLPVAPCFMLYGTDAKCTDRIMRHSDANKKKKNFCKKVKYIDLVAQTYN